MNAFSLPRLSRLRNIFSFILTGMTSAKSKLFLQTLLLGAISAVLYFLLYTFEDRILERSGGFAVDGWYFLAPILIALIFSAVHGVFTSHFWELLGIRAKKPVIHRR